MTKTPTRKERLIAAALAIHPQERDEVQEELVYRHERGFVEAGMTYKQWKKQFPDSIYKYPMLVYEAGGEEPASQCADLWFGTHRKLPIRALKTQAKRKIDEMEKGGVLDFLYNHGAPRWSKPGFERRD